MVLISKAVKYLIVRIVRKNLSPTMVIILASLYVLGIVFKFIKDRFFKNKDKLISQDKNLNNNLETINLNDPAIVKIDSNNELLELYLNDQNLTNITVIEKLEVQNKPIIEFKRVTLDLSGNKLTSLPESIFNLTNLTGLYLNGNKLTAVPESIGNLVDLTELDLRNNELTQFPESVGKLNNFEGLYLTENIRKEQGLI